MKKTAMVLLTVIFTLTLCACGGKNDGGSAELPSETLAQISEAVSVAQTDGSDILFSAMRSEIPFISETGESVLLKDYRFGDAGDIAPKEEDFTFVYVDMDNDGRKELAVYAERDYGAYIIFRYDGENVYGYAESARGMINLKMDGSFIQSDGAGVNRWCSMTFDGAKRETVCHAVKDTDKNIFEIEGKKATAAEVDEYITRWERTPDATWIKL